MTDFPASSWLGFGLDMATVPVPLTPKEAVHAIQQSKRVLLFDQSNGRPITIDGQTYSVPEAIAISQDIREGETFVTFPTGEDATLEFNSDSSLSPRLLPITGGSSMMRPLANFNKSDYQYTYYCLRQPRYLATLSNYDDLFNTEILLEAVQGLPSFSEQIDESVVAEYRKFFQTIGSHVITGVEYGSALYLSNWAARTHPDVNDAWAENVKARYNGIPSGGHFDENVEKTGQYKQFLDILNHKESVEGGDHKLAEVLIHGLEYQTFQEWKGNDGQNPVVVFFHLVELWTLMRMSDNIDLLKAALDLSAAYEWILKDPE
ncbi:hypothetical protein AAF712_004720 [Marasmius tenuissimus]|uniref:MACPF domain-containing protein n=1 Tax=Marasmius tenuissimus TaxID=585030 RepID=A0ABR3A414_9AGAR